MGVNFERRLTTTIAKERQQLKRHVIPALGALPRGEIKPADVRRTVANIAVAGGDASANTCLEVIRRIFAYGVDAELVEINPALGVRSRPRRVRDVTAGDDDIRALWAALEASKADRVHPVVGAKASESYASAAVLQLALLTLQRRGEIVSINRRDVDFEKALWTIPAVVKKERRKGAVPLSPAALAILSAAFEKSGGEWAFPGADPKTHLRPKTVTRYMARLRERGAVKEITPHDLRRTGRTRLTGEELRIDSETAERVLNHTVGSRQHNAYDWNTYTRAKREALGAWAEELARIIRGQSSNIVPFPPSSVAA